MTVVVDKDENRVGLTMSYGKNEALEMLQVLTIDGQDGSGGGPDSDMDGWMDRQIEIER